MKALALVDAPEHVCCRYRVRAFEPALAAAGISLQVERLAAGLAARTAQLLGVKRYDVVILQRKLLPDWQLWILRRRAKRLIFDFDDAVLYRDSYDPRGPHCRRRLHRFSAVARVADVILAGNDFLAARALEAGAAIESVRVLPTCVDTTHYRPHVDRAAGSALNLVWIGSSSTLQGIELQRSLWARIGRAVPSVRLRVISDRFPSFEGLPVENVTWSADGETRELARGDVGISWIPDDLWSRGKCGLKVLQYQAAGLPVVANPVGVHPIMLKPGVNGFLPRSPEEWIEAIRSLAHDEALRRRMGAAARATVEADYSVATWSPAFVAAVVGAGSRRRAGAGGRGTTRRDRAQAFGKPAHRARESFRTAADLEARGD